MEIVGVGTDIVELEGLRRRQRDGTLQHWLSVFTPAELAEVGPPNALYIARLGERFALKEAVYKALGGSDEGEIGWTAIETMTQSGSLSVRLHEEAASLSDSLRIQSWVCDVAHSKAHVIANAIALGILG